MVIEHILTVDVERWSDATLLGGRVERSVGQPLVECQTERVLALLSAASVQATFFVLGEVARDNPRLVRTIAEQGHEIGCHGWTHDLLGEFSQERLRADLTRARHTLQDLSGSSVTAFRAPTWSLDRRVPWAPEVIRRVGFTLDMSIFDGRHGPYGEPVASGGPFRLATAEGDLVELPTSVRTWSGLRAGGGFYWRTLPRQVVRAAYRAKMQPAVGYIHPWEVGRASWLLPADLERGVRLTMTAACERFPEKLAWLLAAIAWRPASQVASALQPTDWPRLRLTANGLAGAERGK